MNSLAPESEASKMLEAALQQMDGIISGASNRNAPDGQATSISQSNVLAAAQTLGMILQQSGNMAPSPDPITAGIINTWLETHLPGCMNNITIGNSNFGYYETVAGGSGAEPTWHGTSGVHTHMTNTRITDPEILEIRYPMILNRFCLREDNSGGRGLYQGGEGVQRELLFRRPVTVSVLTERRVLQPYGMAGGQPGKRGLNLLIKNDGRIISLGGKTAVDVEPVDVFSMRTPGGGGYGNSNYSLECKNDLSSIRTFIERGSVFEYRQAQETV